MKTCSKCGRSNILDRDLYCPNCGSKNLVDGLSVPAQGAPPAFGQQTAPVLKAVVSAGRMQRLAAGFIDILIFDLLSLVDCIPIIGPIIGLVLSVGFFLFRDSNTRLAGPGKRLMGLKLVNQFGGNPSTAQAVLRNGVIILLALGGMGLGEVLPVAGGAFGICIEDLYFLLEAFLIIGTGSRIGDWISQTTVVKA